MEVATQETAYLIDRLVDDVLKPLRKDGIDIDAASRRSLRQTLAPITLCTLWMSVLYFVC